MMDISSYTFDSNREKILKDDCYMLAGVESKGVHHWLGGSELLWIGEVEKTISYPKTFIIQKACDRLVA